MSSFVFLVVPWLFKIRQAFTVVIIVVVAAAVVNIVSYTSEETLKETETQEVK